MHQNFCMNLFHNKQELQALVIANTRQFVAPLRIEFSEEVVPSTKTVSGNFLDGWVNAISLTLIALAFESCNNFGTTNDCSGFPCNGPYFTAQHFV